MKNKFKILLFLWHCLVCYSHLWSYTAAWRKVRQAWSSKQTSIVDSKSLFTSLLGILVHWWLQMRCRLWKSCSYGSSSPDRLGVQLTRKMTFCFWSCVNIKQCWIGTRSYIMCLNLCKANYTHHSISIYLRSPAVYIGKKHTHINTQRKIK